MPLVPTLPTHEEKSRYLKGLFKRTYLRDVVERHNVHNDESVLDDLLNITASSIGSLTSPTKLSKTFLSEKQIRISSATIDLYLGYFADAFLIDRALRYDVKGRKYLQTPLKYYYTDVGLRNAKLGFRQQEETHIMENVLFCDLIRRGYDVDVGVVEQNVKKDDGKKIRRQLEVDFVVNRGEERYYIQSALSVADPEKRRQEIASLVRIPDSFGKIVVVRDYIKPWKDENGVLYLGIEQFLLDEDALEG
jgi:predicted AAA+ superfamily ATPase